MSEQVIIASITGVFGLVTTLIVNFFLLKIKRIEKESEKKEQENSRLKSELKCISVLFEYNLISLLNMKIDHLFEKTSAERFLILFAVNGVSDFNFVSVCYEKMKNKDTIGAIYRYVKVEIDDDYKQMLKTVENKGAVYYEIAKMNDCLLKDIYESTLEEVMFSSVHFLKRLKIDTKNDMLLFSSIATKQKKDFTKNEKLIFKTAMDEIRSHAEQIIVKYNSLQRFG